MTNENIKAIIETNSAKEVNQYISLGWVVLTFASGEYPNPDGCKLPEIKYSLAWCLEAEPKYP